MGDALASLRRYSQGMPREKYTHGHHESVLKSHTWRTIENSAAYLESRLQPGLSLLDVGCGPGTITVEFADRLAPGRVVGLDASAEVIARASAEFGVDLASVKGSGKQGRIRERDVRAAVVPPAAVAVPATTRALPSNDIAVSALRRTIADRMMLSLANTAPVTLICRVDATHLVALAVARHLGIDSVLAVPIYHGGGTRGRRFRAFHTKSESARAVDIPFAEGLRIVRNMFDYRSQRMVMLGLAPSLLMHALVRRSFEYVAVDPAVVPVRPHPGPLLYERARRATSWSDFARVASAFCARELGAPFA